MQGHKRVRRVELKDADQGEVRAVVATTGVVDKDGDIIERGAFGRQEVVVSAFNHESWRGSLPVGKGVLLESGAKAVADLEFFMDTDTARETFSTVKGLGELGQWSFGFDVKGERDPTPAEREDGAVRVLTDLEVHEVSPVLRGAGVDTGTVSAKCDDCGISLDHAPAVDELVEDAKRTLQRSSRESAVWKYQEDADARRLGEFALEVGWKLTRGEAMDVAAGRTAAPDLKWFRAANRLAGTSGFVGREHRVAVALDLKGADLVTTALHELRHLAQDDPKAPGAEADAETFARKWAPAVARAYRLSGGEAWRVSVERGRPPWTGYRSGAVVLSRTTARAWHYNPRNTGDAWT